jgi:PAS domain-containing protein
MRRRGQSASEKDLPPDVRGSRAVKLLQTRNRELIDANPAAEHFYGYAVDDLKRMNISDINTLPPEQIFSDMAKPKPRGTFLFKHRLASGDTGCRGAFESLDLGDTLASVFNSS